MSLAGLERDRASIEPGNRPAQISFMSNMNSKKHRSNKIAPFEMNQEGEFRLELPPLPPSVVQTDMDDVPIAQAVMPIEALMRSDIEGYSINALGMGRPSSKQTGQKPVL